MSPRRLFILAATFAFFTNAETYADRIYLKDGDILGGKIQGREYYHPSPGWCDGESDVMVKSNGTGRCVSREDIVRVERELRKPEGVALLAREDRWGEPQHGYRTQLIPMSEEFVTGKPMKFSLVMQNVTTNLLWYDHQGIRHRPLLVRDVTGSQPYFKVGPSQTGGHLHPIDEGEIVVLFENRDISREQVILKPGQYTVEFHENPNENRVSRFPSSSQIQIDVRPGQPLAEDLLISTLAKALPEGHWQAVTIGIDITIPPAGRTSSKGVMIVLLQQAQLIRDVVSVPVWQTEQECTLATGNVTEQERFSWPSESEFLGANDAGYFYAAISEAAERSWPSIRKDLATALNLENGNGD